MYNDMEVGSYLTWNGWLAIGFLGIFCSGLAYVAWYDGLSVIPAAQVGAFLYLEPFTAVIVAALVLGEPFLLTSLLGGALIILGVWRVQKNS
jgi:drug/metabolite transporter (DMT)-like permease